VLRQPEAKIEIMDGNVKGKIWGKYLLDKKLTFDMKMNRSPV
jgi:hypothetical protein